VHIRPDDSMYEIVDKKDNQKFYLNICGARPKKDNPCIDSKSPSLLSSYNQPFACLVYPNNTIKPLGNRVAFNDFGSERAGNILFFLFSFSFVSSFFLFLFFFSFFLFFLI